MRFTVEYLFQLRDQYSRRANEIARASQRARRDIHAAGNALNQIERNARSAGNTAGLASKKFNMMARSMRNLRTVRFGMGGLGGLMALGGGGLALRNMGSTLLGFSDAINAAEAKFSKGKGLSPERLKLMKDAITELGRTTQFTTRQVGNAMNMLAMAGQSLDVAVGADRKSFRSGALAATLNLAAATQADLPKSADIVTNIMSAYGIAAQNLSKISDVLTVAVNSSNQSIYELAEAMKMAGPASSSFGISLEQTAAMTQALANAGIKGSLAGTGIRRMATRMINVNNESMKVFKKLGIKPSELVGNDGKFKNIFDALERFKQAGMDTGDAFKIFGDRGAPTILRLLTVGPDKLRDFAKALRESNGAAAASASIMMKGLSGAWRTLLSRIEALTIGLGKAGLTDDLIAIANWITRLTDRFNALDDVTKKWIARGLLATAVISAIVIPLGVFAMAVGALVPVITMLVGGLASLGGGLRVVLGLLTSFGAGLAAPLATAAAILGPKGKLLLGLAMLRAAAKGAIVFTVLWEGSKLLLNWEKFVASLKDPINVNVIWPEAPGWFKWLMKRHQAALDLSARFGGQSVNTSRFGLEPNVMKAGRDSGQPVEQLSTAGIAALSSQKVDVNSHVTIDPLRVIAPNSVNLKLGDALVGKIPLSTNRPRGTATTDSNANASP